MKILIECNDKSVIKEIEDFAMELAENREVEFSITRIIVTDKSLGLPDTSAEEVKH